MYPKDTDEDAWLEGRVLFLDNVRLVEDRVSSPEKELKEVLEDRVSSLENEKWDPVRPGLSLMS
jgi:hypothetical protein